MMKQQIRHRTIELSILKLLIFFILFSPGSNQASPETEENEFSKKLLESDFVDGIGFSWMGGQDRKHAVQSLTTMLLDEKNLNQQLRSAIEMRLVAAGDPEITSKLVAKYLDGDRDAENNLARYGRELVIQYFMPNVENGDASERGGDDNYWESEMDGATIRVLRIIEKSTFFPLKTKNWAEYLGENALLKPGFRGPSGKATRELRLWWLNNRAAVLDGEYDKAVWLPARMSQPASSPGKNFGTEIEHGPKNSIISRNPRNSQPIGFEKASLKWLTTPVVLACLVTIIAIFFWELTRKNKSL